jgi:hypothetical protein
LRGEPLKADVMLWGSVVDAGLVFCGDWEVPAERRIAVADVHLQFTDPSDDGKYVASNAVELLWCSL